MKRELATAFVTLLLLVSMFSFLRLDPKTSATVASGAFEPQNNEESPATSAPPVIQDFYVNSTWAGQTSLFSFNVSSPSGDLESVTLSTNVSGSFTNDTLSVSGGVVWANFIKILPPSNCIMAFDFWVFDANASLYATTGLRLLKIYAYNSANGAWNTPFVSLGSALQGVDSANNWTGVDVYDQYILGRNTTSLESMIDSYDANHDWASVLYWSAVCSKLGMTREQAIIDALNNISMLQNTQGTGSLPWNGAYGAYKNINYKAFSVEYNWALYGYYYAAQSWCSPYINQSQWNITSAYHFFNYSCHYDTTNKGSPPQLIFSDPSLTDSYRVASARYYDQAACTIDCYLLFNQLLNVSEAMNDALYWWNWTNTNLWTTAYGGHYKYQLYASNDTFECEAPFFLKIISELKYYDSSLGNWTNVLTDITNRFLGNEWYSYQWEYRSGSPAYVVVHEYNANPQTRLVNTLGAWQALEGVYLQLNSTYEQDMVDMLYGNQVTQPAWALLLSPSTQEVGTSGGPLFDNSTDLFSIYSDNYHDDPNGTAIGEILLFMMGIVPQTTTIAFPLEELDYEYIRDIDPTTLNMNVSTRTLTAPVNSAGTLTFQYGVSPITQQFNSSGVYRVVFSGSWNNIASATRTGDLPKAGFQVTPEFPSTTILTISMALTAFVVVLVKKKRFKRLY